LEESRTNSNYGSFFMSGDPENHTVSVRLLNTYNYLLTFTDEPRRPEPPAQTGGTGRRSGAEWMSEAMGATIKGVGRLIKGLGDAEEAATPAAPQGQAEAARPADDEK
jgi:hypothetical protein